MFEASLIMFLNTDVSHTVSENFLLFSPSVAWYFYVIFIQSGEESRNKFTSEVPEVLCVKIKFTSGREAQAQSHSNGSLLLPTKNEVNLHINLNWTPFILLMPFNILFLQLKNLCRLQNAAIQKLKYYSYNFVGIVLWKFESQRVCQSRFCRYLSGQEFPRFHWVLES
jgi:hypothetical protein